MQRVSRRAVLKSIGLVGLGSLAAGKRLAAQGEDLPPLPPRWQGQPLGRVASAYMNARSEPTTDAEIVSELRQDDIVRVRRLVTGQTVYLHNDQWLETEHGYLYSSFVQPMWYYLPNRPQSDLGDGRWAEVTVPYSEAYWDPDPRDEEQWVDRVYYGAVFRVTGLVEGVDGRSWYRVKELYQSYYVRATHLRLIPDAELSPISPEVDPRDKHIEVNLAKQLLVAYEKDKPVYAHLVSSGLPGHGTPEGIHYIHDKRISDRMVAGAAASDEDADRYNLGGVPFVCYFTAGWVATHGTYWHNDYGIPRSHGCVNLPPYAARWIWRWSTPYADLDALYYRPATLLEGTRVMVY